MLSSGAVATASVSSLVFLLDVDNTLLDNDRFADDLTAHLDASFGAAERERYWTIYNELRDQLGYADYLGAVQKFRRDENQNAPLLRLAAFLLEYPFAERLYPHALEMIAHLRMLGTTAILSDGDMVFQPRKIERAGLWNAVAGEVLIYIHKERMLDAMQRRFPASHYVMIDDKPNLLTAIKQALGTRVTTVFVRQGHYAEAASPADRAAADISVATIGELRGLSRADFFIAQHRPAAIATTSAPRHDSAIASSQ